MNALGIGRLVMALGFMLLPATARAQAALSGGIAGVVRDTTGAVLPGVTVEAASPVLIEKVRVVITDSQGQYKVVDYADELKGGWGASPYLWQVQAAAQHELLANVALNVGYYRTWHGNISLTDNLAVTASDFTPYCITAPANPRLPGGGGYPVCGLYDVSPSRFGQVQNLVTFAPDRSDVFNGVDAHVSARFGEGVSSAPALRPDKR